MTIIDFHFFLANEFGQPNIQANVSVANMSTSPHDAEGKMVAELARLNTMSIRYNKFRTILETPTIDLGESFGIYFHRP